MRSKLNALLLAAPIILASAAIAQLAPEHDFVIGPDSGMPMQTKTATVSMKVDMADISPVKGAPFCATVSTEHTQNLSDGNRIHTTDTAQLCRDSEGRTRRESALNLMGAAPQTSNPRLITITDPVAGVRYLLNTLEKTADKMPMMIPEHPGMKGPVGPAQPDHVFFMQRSGDDGGPAIITKDVFIRKGPGGADAEDPASESLGDQTIEGIHVTGTRLTTTIAAGKMGNEKPIIVTSERWYSPELKAEVMTKHEDPWAGEVKTEFKNVSTTEPDASLFTVPPDYKILEGKNGPLKIRIQTDEPPPAQ